MHTKLEMIILSESLEASSRGLSLGAAEGAEVFLEEEAFFLPELFETPEPEVTFLLEVVEERLGLEEMISSRDLSRLEDIFRDLC